MNIKLENPLIFFDVETTGLDLALDRIIQLSAKKVLPDGTSSVINFKFDPEGREIAPGAFEKHGISAESLKGEPKFRDKSVELSEFFEGCSLGGYNILHFDIPILIQEFERAGIEYDPLKAKVDIVDTYKILVKKEPRNLASTYQFYTGKEMENAHDAGADNEATMEIFQEQMKRYGIQTLGAANDMARKDDNGNVAIDFSGLFLKTKENKYIYGIGKHKGKEVGESQDTIGYLSWVIDKSDHNNSTKYVAKKIMEWVRKRTAQVA